MRPCSCNIWNADKQSVVLVIFEATRSALRRLDLKCHLISGNSTPICTRQKSISLVSMLAPALSQALAATSGMIALSYAFLQGFVLLDDLGLH